MIKPFPSNSFIVLSLKFRSLIHFELTVFDVREETDFILLHMDIQMFHLTPEDKPHRSEGVQYAAEEEWRAITNCSRKNDEVVPLPQSCPPGSWPSLLFPKFTRHFAANTALLRLLFIMSLTYSKLSNDCIAYRIDSKLYRFEFRRGG